MHVMPCMYSSEAHHPSYFFPDPALVHLPWPQRKWVHVMFGHQRTSTCKLTSTMWCHTGSGRAGQRGAAEQHPLRAEPARGDQRPDAGHAVPAVSRLQRGAPNRTVAPSGIYIIEWPLKCCACNKLMTIMFTQHAGTKVLLSVLFADLMHPVSQVRMVEARPGIAFVEFDNDMQASVAMSGLQAFKVTPSNAMAISYAKK